MTDPTPSTGQRGVYPPPRRGRLGVAIRALTRPLPGVRRHREGAVTAPTQTLSSPGRSPAGAQGPQRGGDPEPRRRRSGAWLAAEAGGRGRPRLSAARLRAGRPAHPRPQQRRRPCPKPAPRNSPRLSVLHPLSSPKVRIRKSPGPSLSGLCRAGSTLRVRVSLNCVP